MAADNEAYSPLFISLHISKQDDKMEMENLELLERNVRESRYTLPVQVDPHTCPPVRQCPVRG